jgi:hypothetical protein
MERMTAQKQKLIFRRMLPSFDIQSLVFFRPYVAKNEEAYGIGIEADATLCMLLPYECGVGYFSALRGGQLQVIRPR